MSICRGWLSAMYTSAPTKAKKKFAHAAVLGDSLGYTVELADATQIYVGRAHCKYCARSEALGKLVDEDANERDEAMAPRHP